MSYLPPTNSTSSGRYSRVSTWVPSSSGGQSIRVGEDSQRATSSAPSAVASKVHRYFAGSDAGAAGRPGVYPRVLGPAGQSRRAVLMAAAISEAGTLRPPGGMAQWMSAMSSPSDRPATSVAGQGEVGRKLAA